MDFFSKHFSVSSWFYASCARMYAMSLEEYYQHFANLNRWHIEICEKPLKALHSYETTVPLKTRTGKVFFEERHHRNPSG